jgi:uncharacterized cofD-like protein
VTSRKKPNIVCLGGGTGLPAVLISLKGRANLIAVVNMVDDGRSSGILRRRYSVPPVGDLRNSLIALSKNTKLSKIMGYRFEKGPLAPHSVGNIMLVSAITMFREDGRQGIRETVKLFSELLDIEGKVIPSCEEQVELVGLTSKGRIVRGQVNVSHTRGISKVWIEPDVKASSEAYEAVKHADYIIICPGSLYSSILPVLMTGGLGEALKSSSSKKIWILNLTNERNETYRYTSDDYIRALKRHLGDINLDYVICQRPSKKFTELRHLVKLNYEGLHQIATEVIVSDVADEKNPRVHDPLKLRKVFSVILKKEGN